MAQSFFRVGSRELWLAPVSRHRGATISRAAPTLLTCGISADCTDAINRVHRENAFIGRIHRGGREELRPYYNAEVLHIKHLPDFARHRRGVQPHEPCGPTAGRAPRVSRSGRCARRRRSRGGRRWRWAFCRRRRVFQRG